MDINLVNNKDSYSILFNAMASPCEVIVQTGDEQLALHIANAVMAEVRRIENKYSRYNINSLCCAINNSAGQSIPIDEETFQLFNFADQCFQLSEGLFDITSGVLNKVWTFNRKRTLNENLPTQKEIDAVLAFVGWKKVNFDHNQVTLPKGMAIDFGGIGKEYAVDRSIIIIKELTRIPALVNLGGDIAVTSARLNNKAWQVAVEPPAINKQHSQEGIVDMVVSLKSGALATSGDSKRFIEIAGHRYGHILNANTGWPIVNAPRSITVAAPQCIQAGILATMALLQGINAEKFLEEQQIKFWARK